MPLVGTRGVFSSRGTGEMLLSTPGIPSPVNTVAPSVSGPTVVGNTLSCTTGTWLNSPTGYTYQWYAASSQILGATSSTYVISGSYVGDTIYCVVTATNLGGSNSANSNTVGPVTTPSLLTPVNFVAPSISGGVASGDTLSCSPGSWTNSPLGYTYQWYSTGTGGISGQTGSTYTIDSSQAGYYIYCQVDAYNGAGYGSPANSGELGPVTVPVAPLTIVSLTAIPTGGETVPGYAVNGSDVTFLVQINISGGVGPYTYVFDNGYTDFTPLGPTTITLPGTGAGWSYSTTGTNQTNSASFGVSVTDSASGFVIGSASVSVIFNTTGSPASVPVNTSAPSVSGSTSVGSVLSCTTGTWTNSPTGYTYQWYESGHGAISGQTSSSYIIDSSMVGNDIYCQVSGYNGVGGGAAVNSNAVGPVAGGVPVDLSSPSISGSLSVGSVLSCATGSWSNSPTGYYYQWYSSTTGMIAGQTSSTYTIDSSQAGNNIYCGVAGYNTSGVGSAANSAAVGPVTTPLSAYIGGGGDLGGTSPSLSGAIPFECVDGFVETSPPGGGASPGATCLTHMYVSGGSGSYTYSWSQSGATAVLYGESGAGGNTPEFDWYWYPPVGSTIADTPTATATFTSSVSLSCTVTDTVHGYSTTVTTSVTMTFNAYNIFSTCFPAGSKVLMADGTWKNIETVVLNDNVMGMIGSTPVTSIHTPYLGGRQLLKFADSSLSWSDEHAMWTKSLADNTQWWWTSNKPRWIREATTGIIRGLTDNSSIRTGTADTEWANLNGWVSPTVEVDTSTAPYTQLYYIETGGSPIIVNGYVVGAGVNQTGFDYTNLNWDAIVTTINNSIVK